MVGPNPSLRPPGVQDVVQQLRGGPGIRADPTAERAAPGLRPEPHVIDALLVEDVLALERVALGVRRELVPANPADGLWHSGARRD